MEAESADSYKPMVEESPDIGPIRSQREPPPLIKYLTTEDRAALERRLVRKIDRRLLPMIILMYIMNYLDRNNIASARLQGLQKDLGMDDTQYQVWQVSNT